MSKSSNKSKGVQAACDLSLVSKTKEILAGSERLAKIIQDNVIFKIRRYMADLLIMASRNARLSGYDEKIYDTYKTLIEYYCLSIRKYDECIRMISNPKIKTIIDGIHSVLKSETRNKEETISESDENPILLEKKAIVSKSLSFFSKAIEGTIDSFVDEKTESIQSEVLKAIIVNKCSDNPEEEENCIFRIAEKMVDEINIECFPSFNKYFEDSLKYCVSSLNDIGSRKTTGFYYELLEKEVEILSSIVKIQVIAVDNEKYNSVSEKMAVNYILSYLLEAYQVLSKSMIEIESCFNYAEKTNLLDIKPTLTAETVLQPGFVKDLYRVQKFKTCKKIIDKDIDEFTDILKIRLKAEIQEDILNRHIRKKAYSYNLKIAQVLDMTNDMINAFRGIIESYNNEKDGFPEGESFEIIKGIYETVCIKIECLEENKNAFKEDISPAMAGLKACTLDFKQDEFDADINKAVLLILGAGFDTLDDEKAEKNYCALIKSSLLEVYHDKIPNYKNAFEKSTSNFEEKLDKTEFTFKKDYLLYEVTTFEEILNYSVTRIALDPTDNIVAFVKNIYNSVEMVEIALKKNGIVKISPEPHSMFNSKEHEVLMVEKNPDFNKGEVIKLMNSGYKQNDVVIIRANIIAAK